MRRGLAGLLFVVAAVLLAVAAGGWWMQRVAFDTEFSRKTVTAVFDHDQLRDQVAGAIGAATADRLGRSPEQMTTEIVSSFPGLVGDTQTRGVLSDVIVQAHAVAIGERSDPVTITGPQMVPIVRNQVVADVPTITLPVEEVSWLSLVRTVLTFLVPISAILGLVGVILGIFAHPTRADAAFGLGVFFVGAAVAAFLLGYVVPAYAVPALTDDGWADVVPTVAESQRGAIGAIAVASALVGCALVFGSAGFRRRKSKGWSAPVRQTRYSTEQRQWSR